ncbi:MAG: hypothetical protein AAF434_17145 [Pseudomonadota bacterium]
MPIEVRVKLQPFRTPNFVLVEDDTRPRQEGFQESPKYALSDLDATTLSQLCDKFREDVFKKADKVDPK